MAPLADAVRRRRAGFEHERRLVPRQEMRGGGKADRAGTDDGDGQRAASCHAFRF